MARTIQEIVGEFGIPLNADSSPISSAETGVLESIAEAVKQMNSIQTERAVGQGTGMSTFESGLRQKASKDLFAGGLRGIASSRQGQANMLEQIGLQGQIGKEARADELKIIQEQSNQSLMNSLYGSLLSQYAPSLIGGVGGFIGDKLGQVFGSNNAPDTFSAESASGLNIPDNPVDFANLLSSGSF